MAQARECATRALVADPRNPVALQEPGRHPLPGAAACALSTTLRRSNECDPQHPQTVNGLAFAYMELRDIELAQRQFQAVLKMKAPEELRGLARDGLRRIAAREVKARSFCRAHCKC